MATSTYLADAILEWLRGSSFPEAPDALFVSVHTVDPGGDGVEGDVTAAVLGGRVELLQSDLSPVEAAPYGRQVNNEESLTLTYNALSSATLTHYGLWNADVTEGGSNLGEFLVSGELSTAVAVNAGDLLRFSVGQLTISVGGCPPTSGPLG